ncbi:hypothetical protein LLEC1_01039 [Akanthomyces lecanii]|uniref:Porphobilinogen deaminase n=1 Tax=Cordyceps confragosa TaxID=2714763 RepID=A0A179I301_CORDF|nr:hypothetical protein LLEC1_01039 [Akanthomyces lecanii]
MADSTAQLPTVRIGTRQSVLAKIQAEGIRDTLQKRYPYKSFEVDAMRTLGDRDKITALYSFEGKNLWTSELEEKLAAGKIDVIVHCLKDMPTSLPDDCELAVIPARDDARDALIIKAGLPHTSLQTLPEGAVVGTSSVRRAAQLRRLYPHLRFANLRGNVDTRLAKVDDPESEYTCMIMSAAGLERMGLQHRISQYLGSKDGGIYHALEGGCSVPIGAETEWVKRGTDEYSLRLRAIVVSLDGKTAVDDALERVIKTNDEAEAFGHEMAETLVKGGAKDILQEIIANRPPKG